MMDAAQVADNAATYKYLDLCQNCIWKSHPTMLTGYCITGCRCECCGRMSDLAIVRIAK